MIIAIRGLGGAIGSTLVLGTALAKLDSESYPMHGSILARPQWERLQLPPLADISFHGWDISKASIIERARTAGIISPSDINRLETVVDVRPRPAPVLPTDVDSSILATDQAMPVSSRNGLEYYVNELKSLRQVDDVVVGINLASTEYWNRDITGIRKIDELEALVESNSSMIRSGTLFAMACIKSGVPYCDFTPDTSLECPALLQMAKVLNVPVAGKDGNTGQTFLKLVLGEMLVRRNLQIAGWYSTNILGNSDGMVLSLPGHRDTKLHDKVSALNDIVPYPFSHVVDISFEESRGDYKESWDSINITGWLNYRIALRVNWRSSDSILAAPLVLDIARLLAFEGKRGSGGIQTQLAPFFKNPIGVKRVSALGELTALEEFYHAG